MADTEVLDDKVDSSTTKSEDDVVSKEPDSSTESQEKGGFVSSEKLSSEAQDRINRLTREKHDARQETADLRKRVDELESKPSQETKAQPTAPKEDDFETDAAFQTANANFIAETAANKAIETVRAENDSRDQATQETERQTSLKTKKTTFETQVESKREHFEDFDEVAYGHQFMDLDMAEQIFDMDKGPEVAYHLGSHLDDAERIFALNPVQRARELTKLEFQIEALSPKVVSDAPDAIKPLGNKETVEVDPDKMTADEWQKWRNDKVGLVNG